MKNKPTINRKDRPPLRINGRPDRTNATLITPDPPVIKSIIESVVPIEIVTVQEEITSVENTDINPSGYIKRRNK